MRVFVCVIRFNLMQFSFYARDFEDEHERHYSRYVFFSDERASARRLENLDFWTLRRMPHHCASIVHMLHMESSAHIIMRSASKHRGASWLLWPRCAVRSLCTNLWFSHVNVHTNQRCARLRVSARRVRCIGIVIITWWYASDERRCTS